MSWPQTGNKPHSIPKEQRTKRRFKFRSSSVEKKEGDGCRPLVDQQVDLMDWPVTVNNPVLLTSTPADQTPTLIPEAVFPPQASPEVLQGEEKQLLVIDEDTLANLLAQCEQAPLPAVTSDLTRARSQSWAPGTAKTDSVGTQNVKGNNTITTFTTAASCASKLRRPTKHLTTFQKLKNWNLSVRHKWLVVGDSNVARFPPFDIPHLQVDSYPEATFAHLKAVLDKIEPNTSVEVLILSAGLFNKTQKRAETAVRELRRLMTTAKGKFPHAQIWLPLINFSNTLPRSEQLFLEKINHFILGHYQSLGAVPNDQFAVENDQIHWTRATAGLILDHWAATLN